MQNNMNRHEDKLRAHAARIIGSAVRAAQPERFLGESLSLRGDCLHIIGASGEILAHDIRPAERIMIIAVGKAASGMASAAQGALGNRVTDCLVITKHGHATPRLAGSTSTIIEAGHPLPDAHSIEAGESVARILDESGEADLVLFLVSGGASSLLAAPAAGISLGDLQSMNELLLAAGAPIQEINTVRKHISVLKGGRAAARANPATVLSLVLSDVIGDPLDVIGGGPTTPDPTTYADALGVLGRFDLHAKVPASIREHLISGEKGNVPDTPMPGDMAFDRTRTIVIANNSLALQAATEEAEALGYLVVQPSESIEGEAREFGKRLGTLAISAQDGDLFASSRESISGPLCILFGGETTVTLRGAGSGGRCQEAALAAALSIEGREHMLVACVGTDGTDGPTEAAGALCSGATCHRALELGMDPGAFLDHNDSNTFFSRLEDLIVTGPTGTNVGDIYLALVETDSADSSDL